MALKDILLHLDNSPGCLARLELAISLARTHGAHLKGLHVLSHSYYAPRNDQVKADAAKAAEDLFTEKTAHAGISAEWLCVDWSVIGVTIAEIINLYAYYSDLVIIGQPDHSSQDPSTPPDLPERLGLGAGRPLLVVPYTGAFTVTGERIMVAWKAGREATRALNDAMPLLEKAHHVSVVTIIATAGSYDSSEENNALMICSHLARHQVTAGHEQIIAASNISIGDTLLNQACEQKIDLLVMGAYAQTRRGVFMLSPVAKHLICHMTVPILISH